MLHMALYNNNALATTLSYNITTILTKQIAADGTLPKVMSYVALSLCSFSTPPCVWRLRPYSLP